MEKRTGDRLPKIAWKHAGFEHFAGGRNCTAVRINDETIDVWAIRADDPDKNVAQRIWVTEAIVGRKPGQRALFGLRLLVSSPEQQLRIDPAVPGLVRQLASQCGLYHGSDLLDPRPKLVDTSDAAEKLIDALIDPKRRLPILVLTVPENSGHPARPLVEAEPIARALIGIAQVFVVPAPYAWALTERFGKRLSVYNGAIRIYLPGFSDGANPYGGHELVLSEKLLSPEGKSQASSWVRHLAANESLRSLRLGQDVLPYAHVRAQSLDLERARLVSVGASDTERLSAAQTQIATLDEDLRKAQEAQQWISDEHQQMEDRARTAEAQLTAASYRIQQLLDQLKKRGESPDADIALPQAWSEFADWCDQHLVGRVLLSRRARREVKAPLYGDVGVAAQCLLWLANDYRDRRISGGTGDLRIQVQSGIENDRCGADSFKIDWPGPGPGARRDVEWHLKNGGNTKDPSRCLRIYYFWDESSLQVIIASMPAHTRTGAT